MNQVKPKKLSLFMAIAMVIGTMIGSGIFLLPASLAPFGAIGFVGWIMTSLGAIFLALSLGRLSKQFPQSGGPYVYTRNIFGDFPAFLVAWGYWISLLIGGAAIAVAAVGYIGFFLPIVAEKPMISAGLALILMWTLIGLNLSGPRNVGKFQVVSTILKVLPLLLVVLAAFYFFDVSHFEPFNPSDKPHFSAVMSVATLTLWAFLGLEVASVVAENVENPSINVRKATIIGTSITAVIYLVTTFAIMGILPRDVLAVSTAPFSDASAFVFGSWTGYLVAAGAIISCLGALNGLIFSIGQMPFAVSRDQLFPEAFSRLNDRGAPGFSLIISGVITTVFLIMNYSKGLVELFTFMILISTLSILLPYAFSALSEIVLIWKTGKTNKPISWKNLILAILAFVYSIWAIIGSGYSAILWGLVLLVLGLPVYYWFRQKRTIGSEK